MWHNIHPFVGPFAFKLVFAFGFLLTAWRSVYYACKEFDGFHYFCPNHAAYFNSYVQMATRQLQHCAKNRHVKKKSKGIPSTTIKHFNVFTKWIYKSTYFTQIIGNGMIRAGGIIKPCGAYFSYLFIYYIFWWVSSFARLKQSTKCAWYYVLQTIKMYDALLLQ